jgi:hypothetical protein
MIYRSIGSQTEIGINELKDKGLGFEALNVNNKDHEYSQLNEENRALLLEIRETVIEFVLKMTEKLVEEKSNDTTLLILISRVFSELITIYLKKKVKFHLIISIKLLDIDSMLFSFRHVGQRV